MEGKKKVGRRLVLDFIYTREQVCLFLVLFIGYSYAREFRPGYFDPDGMIRVGGEGRRREDEREGGGVKGGRRMTRRETSVRPSSEMRPLSGSISGVN